MSLRADTRAVFRCQVVIGIWRRDEPSVNRRKKVYFVSEEERTNLCHDADSWLGRLKSHGIKNGEKTEGENVKESLLMDMTEEGSLGEARAYL